MLATVKKVKKSLEKAIKKVDVAPAPVKEVKGKEKGKASSVGSADVDKIVEKVLVKVKKLLPKLTPGSVKGSKQSPTSGSVPSLAETIPRSPSESSEKEESEKIDEMSEQESSSDSGGGIDLDTSSAEGVPPGEVEGIKE